MITVEDVIAFAVQDTNRRVTPIGVYWYEPGGDRQHAATELTNATDKVCIIPLLPRGGFDNANALSADFIELVEKNRSFVEPLVLDANTRGQTLCFVLVTRTRLREPLIGSPVKIPNWIPGCGGLVVPLDIVDVSAAATSTLKSQSDAVGRVQVLLYEIQGQMIQRLLSSRVHNRNATHQFFAEILTEGQKAAEFLAEAEKRHGLSTADGFRAVASPKSNELLGRMVATIGARTPAQLPTFGQALFSALSIDSEIAKDFREPLFCVALRSTNKDFEGNKATRITRNVALTLYCSSQLVTAAAHAGEYGEFQVASMRTMFEECESSLAMFRTLL